MKKIWFYLVMAVAVMFTLPATAAEDYEGFAAVYSDAMPAIVAIDDSPMLAERSSMPQLEAAALLASKSGIPGIAKISDYHPGHAISVAGPDERGWRKVA